MTRRDVVPNPMGGWDVKSTETRVTSHHARQRDAVARAKEILQNGGGGEWHVKDAHGRLVESGHI